jgi:hypothetical protein
MGIEKERRKESWQRRAAQDKLIAPPQADFFTP